MWKFIILALLLVVPLSSCGDFENGSAQQGSKEEDSWLHEINIDLPDLSEYGTILDAYIPMEDGQYHSQSSSCGLNVHIEAGDEHFHQEYGRSEINSKMIYWCSRCEN